MGRRDDAAKGAGESSAAFPDGPARRRRVERADCQDLSYYLGMTIAIARTVSAGHVAMAAEILCGRVNNEIGGEIERSL